jgi:hypothetical protein
LKFHYGFMIAPSGGGGKSLYKPSRELNGALARPYDRPGAFAAAVLIARGIAERTIMLKGNRAEKKSC